jgi:hypothetical protein
MSPETIVPVSASITWVPAKEVASKTFSLLKGIPVWVVEKGAPYYRSLVDVGFPYMGDVIYRSGVGLKHQAVEVWGPGLVKAGKFAGRGVVFVAGKVGSAAQTVWAAVKPLAGPALAMAQRAAPSVVTVIQLGAVSNMILNLAFATLQSDPEKKSRYIKMAGINAATVAITGIFVGFQATTYAVTAIGLGMVWTAGLTGEKINPLKLIVSTVALAIIANTMLRAPLFAAMQVPSMAAFSLAELGRVTSEVAWQVFPYLKTLPLRVMLKGGVEVLLSYMSIRGVGLAFTERFGPDKVIGACAAPVMLAALRILSSAPWTGAGSFIAAGLLLGASATAVDIATESLFGSLLNPAPAQPQPTPAAGTPQPQPNPAGGAAAQPLDTGAGVGAQQQPVPTAEPEPQPVPAQPKTVTVVPSEYAHLSRSKRLAIFVGCVAFAVFVNGGLPSLASAPIPLAS